MSSREQKGQRLQQLDLETLNKLQVPSTTEERQGLDFLFTNKILSLVYIVNPDVDEFEPKHEIENRAAAPISTGVDLTAPINERWLIPSIRVYFNTNPSVVAGSRIFVVRRQVKAGSAITFLDEFVEQTTALDTDTTVYLSMYEHATTLTGIENVVNRILRKPIVLEPEWSIHMEDIASIDEGVDTLAYTADVIKFKL